MSVAGVLLASVEDRTDPVGPAPVMHLWHTAELLTRLVQQHPELVAELQTAAKAVEEAEKYGSCDEQECAEHCLAEAKFALIAASGELRELASGGAR